MKNWIPKITAIFLASVLLAPFCQAEKIGVMGDIHAGSEKVRNRSKFTSGNIVYPRKYKTYFSRALRQMKNSGARIVISLGDQVDKGRDTKRSKNLVTMARKEGLEMIWLKGNHESGKSSRIFFPDGSYYFERDLDNWKIIALDTNEKYSFVNGGIKDAQMEWLREKINETEKHILIAMHHPIFQIRQGAPDEIATGWDEFESLVSSSGKVSYVLAGHTHPRTLFEKDLHNVQYYVVPPLTIKGNLGYFMTLDLD